MSRPGDAAAHGQHAYSVRFDWGPTGAPATAAGADIAVVVDVLSFTTTLTVAVEAGLAVLPYRWHDDGAAAYADEHDAVLAVGRFEAREQAAPISLSPAHLAALAPDSGIERIVLPSPNGSTISFQLSGGGAQVVGACLRNASAVAATAADRGGTVMVVAAGERWPDGSLRPAVEDLWGAGAVLHALQGLGIDGFSPEAEMAAAAFAAVRDRLPQLLGDCAGGRELAAAGFADDVRIAAELDASTAVPRLVGETFVGSPT